MRSLADTARRDAGFEANRDHWRTVLDRLRAEEGRISEGGGAKAAERQKSQGKMLARERLGVLLDRGTPFLELGLWAGWGMYEEWGGAPGAGCVTGVGTVSGPDLRGGRQRRHRQGRRLVSDHAQEDPSGAGDRPREPAPDRLPGGLGRRLPAASGGDLPRQGALRAGVLQQRAALGGRDLSDRRDHGTVRGGRSVPPDHVRRGADRREDRLDLPGGAAPREGRDRGADRDRGAGRRGGADRRLDGRRRPFPRRRVLPGGRARPHRPACRAASRAVRPHRAGRAGGGPRGDPGRRSGGPDAALRHLRAARTPPGRVRVRGVQGHLRTHRWCAAPAASRGGRSGSSPTSGRSCPAAAASTPRSGRCRSAA